MCDIALMVGISLSSVQFILKTLNLRKISARWVPYLLADDHWKQRVKILKRILKMFPEYNQSKLTNVVNGNETRIHYFKPVQKQINRIWSTRSCKRPIIARLALSTKKVLYAIFN